MKCQSWDGVNRTEPNTGLPEIHGEATGAKVDFSESSGESEISTLKETAHGLYPLTHGPEI